MAKKTKPTRGAATEQPAEELTLDETPIPDETECEDAQPVCDAQIEELTQKLDAATKQADEYLTLAQRVQADFDNFRRRNQAVRAEAFDDGAKEFIKTLLPVLDNLERALDAPSTDEALHTGVQMVFKQLTDALTKRGVTVISRKGEKFDPSQENAVLRGTEEDGEPGTVCEVLQKGYALGASVLRHAVVKVVPE